MWSTAKSSKSQRHSVSKSSKSSPETSRTTKASSKLTESPPSNDNDQAVVKQQGPDPLPNMASFLHGMKRKSLLKNSSSTIIAIVERDDVKDLVKLIEDKKKKIDTKMIVTAPKHLQEKIDALTKAGRKIPELRLVAGPAIQYIAYRISGLIRNVHVMPCTKGRPNGLQIGSRSTYCDFPTYAWDNRPKDLQQSERMITHYEGCHWDVSDCRAEADLLLKPSLAPMPSLEEHNLAKARDQFAEVREKHMPNGSGSSPNSGGDGTPGWLTNWKAIIGTAVSAIATAGYAGTYGFFWYSSTGLLIKGPFGLSLALGHTTSVLTGGSMMAMASAGAAAGAATASLIFAGAFVYYIPKDTVFDLLKKTFWKIWDVIRDVASWLWEGVKHLSVSFYEVFDGSWS